MDDKISLEDIAGDDVMQHLSMHHFSLMTSLFSVLNATRAGDPNNVIAHYFLEHFDELADLNIYDVVEACYTSRSGIRRFCQEIGFENFTGIKYSAYEWKRQSDYFLGYARHDDYRSYLPDRLGKMCETINQLIDERTLVKLATVMHEANEVVLAATDFSATALRDFQQAMLVMHKIVRVFTDSIGDEEVFDILGPRDIVLVTSATGNYARVARPRIERLSAQRVLITMNQDPALAEPYDTVLYLSRKDLKTSRSVYAKYGVNYLFDLLYNVYCRLYG